LTFEQPCAARPATAWRATPARSSTICCACRRSSWLCRYTRTRRCHRQPVHALDASQPKALRQRASRRRVAAAKEWVVGAAQGKQQTLPAGWPRGALQSISSAASTPAPPRRRAQAAAPWVHAGPLQLCCCVSVAPARARTPFTPTPDSSTGPVPAAPRACEWRHPPAAAAGVRHTQTHTQTTRPRRKAHATTTAANIAAPQQPRLAVPARAPAAAVARGAGSPAEHGGCCARPHALQLASMSHTRAHTHTHVHTRCTHTRAQARLDVVQTTAACHPTPPPSPALVRVTQPRRPRASTPTPAPTRAASFTYPRVMMDDRWCCAVPGRPHSVSQQPPGYIARATGSSTGSPAHMLTERTAPTHARASRACRHRRAALCMCCQQERRTARMRPPLKKDPRSSSHNTTHALLTTVLPGGNCKCSSSAQQAIQVQPRATHAAIPSTQLLCPPRCRPHTLAARTPALLVVHAPAMQLRTSSPPCTCRRRCVLHNRLCWLPHGCTRGQQQADV
jgi:hypothetical protein